MRRLVPILLTLALAATACAKSDSTTTTAAGATTTTAAATTTTAAAATTTTAAAGPSLEDLAAAFAGHYTGEWHNTTFGSSGSLDMQLNFEAGAGSIVATTDLGGNVFGASDPDPILEEFDLVYAANHMDGDTVVFEMSNSLLGEYTMRIDPDGTMTLDAPEVPGLGMQFHLTGVLVAGPMSLTYTINNGDTVYAEGTIDVTPAS